MIMSWQPSLTLAKDNAPGGKGMRSAGGGIVARNKAY
jgi:hypothetical protein